VLTLADRHGPPPPVSSRWTIPTTARERRVGDVDLLAVLYATDVDPIRDDPAFKALIGE
jgi:hypothetical protein